jgi:hypothetical protein
MVLVAINPPKDDSLAVDFDQSIFHFNLTEANTLSDMLLLKRNDKMVEVW